MGTEDDTFNTLRRIPFNEMRRKLITRSIASVMGLEHRSESEILEENGWDLTEYNRVCDLTLLKDIKTPYGRS